MDALVAELELHLLFLVSQLSLQPGNSKSLSVSERFQKQWLFTRDGYN